jgi:predicted transcriptional regulator
VDAEKIAELVEFMKARRIINSRRDLARKTGLASTTIDTICNEPGEVDSKISTIEAITKFALKHMPDLYGADSDKLVDDLLGEDAPLRRDLKQALSEGSNERG